MCMIEVSVVTAIAAAGGLMPFLWHQFKRWIAGDKEECKCDEVKKSKLLEGLLTTQKKFVESKSKFPLYVGGFGSGKTYALCRKAIKNAIEDFPGRTGLLISFLTKMSIEMTDDIIPMLSGLLTDFGIDYKFCDKTNQYYLTDCQSTIMLKAIDDPELFEESSNAWAGIDEVARVHPEVWEKLVSRITLDKPDDHQLFAATVPEGLNWVYDKWVENSSDDYQLFHASAAENMSISEDYLSALAASHDEDELKQKLNGEFTEETQMGDSK